MLTAQILVSGNVDTGAPGDYTLSYSVSDAAQNTATALRTVQVRDTEAPDIALAGQEVVTVECGADFDDPGATASDTCDGDLTAQIEVAGALDTSAPADYTLTYTVADTAGNQAAATRTVQVRDTVAPVLALVGEQEVAIECGAAFTDPGATAIDTCAGDLTAAIETDGAVDTGAPGAYAITYTVADGAGNEAQTVRTVTVEDTTPPVLVLSGGIEDGSTLSFPCGTPFAPISATAADTCGGDLTGAVSEAGSVDVMTPGQYTLTFSVSDSADNEAAVSVTVEIIDEEAPVVTLLGESGVVLSCGQPFADPGATASDVCGGDLSSAIEVVGTVRTSEPGEYTLRYIATDEAGNTGEAARTVTVLDDCTLEITQQPQPVAVYEGMPFTFRVAIARYEDAAYDWRKDGVSLGAPSAAVYSGFDAAPEDAGVYSCYISRGGDGIESSGATLTVLSRPAEGQHAGDTNGDWQVSLSELLRIIQFYNLGEMQCDETTEDGYAGGQSDRDCPPHSADYNPQDWRIGLSELLRIIQFYNSLNGAYRPDPGSEDGYAPGAG